jgi:hypothetical protein
MKFFNLYANCIPVQGNQESIVVDLQNNEFINIPNLLVDVLGKTRSNTISEIKNFFNNDLNEGINHYFKYLKQIDYGFFLNNIENFPELDLDWHSPLRVNDAILEINDYCQYDFNSAIIELSNLGCSNIQIRISTPDINNILLNIIDATRLSRIKSVEILLPEFLFADSITSYLEDIETRISFILVHSVADENLVKNVYKNSSYYKDNRLMFISKVIDTTTTDVIKLENFITNMDFFCETQSYNVALNRKVCMDNSDVQFNGSSWSKLNKCPFDPYTNTWEIDKDIL